MKEMKKIGSVTRRDFIRASTIVAGAGMAVRSGISALAADSRPTSSLPAPGAVALNLLDEKALPMDTGVSFGVPWQKGAVRKTDNFVLTSKGKPLPTQSWPLAYWPDGSVKFIGLATVVPAGEAGPITVRAGSATSFGDLKLVNDGKSVLVDTGVLKCSIPTSGSNIVDSMSIAGKEIASKGRLVCILQIEPQAEPDDAPSRERFVSTIKKVTVEQSGPVRATVKIEGLHKGERSRREWLPFTVRLYFYTGQTAVRVVHTIIFDGDQEKDFVRGLGLQFGVPMREEPETGQCVSPVRTAECGRSLSSPAAVTGLRKTANLLRGIRSLRPMRYGTTSDCRSRIRTDLRYESGLIRRVRGYRHGAAGVRRKYPSSTRRKKITPCRRCLGRLNIGIR